MDKYIADRLPLYMQVAMKLAGAINSQKFPVGAMLPTEERLCDQYSVSRHTVREAIRYLRDQGILTSRRGVGTRVEALSSQVADTMSPTVRSQPGSKKRPGAADISGPEKDNPRRHRDWVHLQSLHLTAEEVGHSVWMDVYVEKAKGTRSPVVHLLLETRPADCK